jgi:hypothetical protein
MSGRVTPYYAGQPAYLMKRTCDACSFKTVKRVRTSSRGGYRFAFAAPASTSTYVVRARASRGLSVSYSRPARITVR